MEGKRERRISYTVVRSDRNQALWSSSKSLDAHTNLKGEGARFVVEGQSAQDLQ